MLVMQSVVGIDSLLAQEKGFWGGESRYVWAGYYIGDRDGRTPYIRDETGTDEEANKRKRRRKKQAEKKERPKTEPRELGHCSLGGVKADSDPESASCRRGDGC